MITSTDPIADMLTRIRNAATAGKSEISLPHSSLKAEVAKVLADQGFVLSTAVAKDGKHNVLNIRLSSDGANSSISHIRRLSKPGRRIYASSGQIPVVRRGRGIVILSTSKGVMSDAEARKKKLGGELICEVF